MKPTKIFAIGVVVLICAHYRNAHSQQAPSIPTPDQFCVGRFSDDGALHLRLLAEIQKINVRNAHVENELKRLANEKAP